MHLDTRLKNHSLVAIDKYVVVYHLIECFAEYILLNISSCLCHIFRAKVMIDRNHVLLDDWSFVEVISDEVRCCTNDLNASLVSLLVRLRANESGQEAMVDINDLMVILFDE